MSYRYLSPPSQGFASGLSSLLSRIRVLNQRIKRPGAIQASFPDDVNVNQDVDTVVASVTLDPGRWLVAGGTSFHNFDVVGLGYLAFCSIVGGPFAATIGGIGPQFRTTPGTDNLTVFSTGIITERTVVELSTKWDQFGGSPSPYCIAQRIFLIATPA